MRMGLGSPGVDLFRAPATHPILISTCDLYMVSPKLLMGIDEIMSSSLISLHITNLQSAFSVLVKLNWKRVFFYKKKMIFRLIVDRRDIVPIELSHSKHTKSRIELQTKRRKKEEKENGSE